ncbi:hypothetical protein OEZ86_003368 [Tetradesmus obliquus]|nr:hypothetical protein OEZ86_003368 [Tetradesmus obliquus]
MQVAKAHGVKPMAAVVWRPMLESYLLGLFCPSEQQQRSNQAAAVQAATLAVQGAARVVHVSHGSEDDDDEEEQQQQQEQQQEPGSSSTPATAAGAAASTPAFDEFVCKFVTSRRVATLWDLRQQLLALHGLRQHPRALEQTRLLLQLSPPAYAGGQAAGLMVSPAARRFFSPAAELAEVPAVTARGIAHAVLCRELRLWLAAAAPTHAQGTGENTRLEEQHSADLLPQALQGKYQALLEKVALMAEATLKSRACFSEQGYLAAFAGNLAELATEAQELTGCQGARAKNPRSLQGVQRPVLKARACCGDKEEQELSAAVSRCLCATFGVQHVQQLGHGSTQRLLHLCAAAAAAAADTLAGCPGSSQSCVWGVHALAAPVSSPSAAAAAAAAGIANQPAADQSLQLRQEVPEGAAAGDSAGAAGSVSVEDALCCLAAAPQLAELHGWSSWQQVYQPSLGPLAQFLAAHGAASRLLVLSVPAAAAGAAAACGAMPGQQQQQKQQQQQQQLLKLDASASRDHLMLCSSKGDGVGAVSCALSLVALSAGLRFAPLSLMAEHIAAGLQVLAAKHSWGSVCGRRTGRGDAERQLLLVVLWVMLEEGAAMLSRLWMLVMQRHSSPQQGPTRQNARLGRALQRLSQELYSSSSHFVLELVQNADDNRYPPAAVPALEFLLLPNFIAALNNEAGLSAADLAALCDIGASTKLEQRWIGYKGIGFKSVFKACQMLWQPGWTSGCAKTLGEECEQLFSHLSRFSGTTRNQSSAGSSDALTEAALHFGRQKRAKQSLLLVQRYKKFKEQETRAEAERQLASLEQTPPQEREQLVRDLHDELRAMARGADTAAGTIWQGCSGP